MIDDAEKDAGIVSAVTCIHCVFADGAAAAGVEVRKEEITAGDDLGAIHVDVAVSIQSVDIAVGTGIGGGALSSADEYLCQAVSGVPAAFFEGDFGIFDGGDYVGVQVGDAPQGVEFIDQHAVRQLHRFAGPAQVAHDFGFFGAVPVIAQGGEFAVRRGQIAGKGVGERGLVLLVKHACCFRKQNGTVAIVAEGFQQAQGFRVVFPGQRFDGRVIIPCPDGLPNILRFFGGILIIAQAGVDFQSRFIISGVEQGRGLGVLPGALLLRGLFRHHGGPVRAVPEGGHIGVGENGEGFLVSALSLQVFRFGVALGADAFLREFDLLCAVAVAVQGLEGGDGFFVLAAFGQGQGFGVALGADALLREFDLLYAVAVAVQGLEGGDGLFILAAFGQQEGLLVGAFPYHPGALPVIAELGEHLRGVRVFSAFHERQRAAVPLEPVCLEGGGVIGHVAGIIGDPASVLKDRVLIRIVQDQAGDLRRELQGGPDTGRIAAADGVAGHAPAGSGVSIIICTGTVGIPGVLGRGPDGSASAGLPVRGVGKITLCFVPGHDPQLSDQRLLPGGEIIGLRAAEPGGTVIIGNVCEHGFGYEQQRTVGIGFQEAPGRIADIQDLSWPGDEIDDVRLQQQPVDIRVDPGHGFIDPDGVGGFPGFRSRLGPAQQLFPEGLGTRGAVAVFAGEPVGEIGVHGIGLHVVILPDAAEQLRGVPVPGEGLAGVDRVRPVLQGEVMLSDQVELLPGVPVVVGGFIPGDSGGIIPGVSQAAGQDIGAFLCQGGRVLILSGRLVFPVGVLGPSGRVQGPGLQVVAAGDLGYRRNVSLFRQFFEPRDGLIIFSLVQQGG